MINVAQIEERTEAEGPGVRFALWVQGCPFRCKGCCNPEQLPFEPRSMMDAGELAERVIASNVEGVSLLGGEPFAQAEHLRTFARYVHDAGMSVMIYTGYTLAELDDVPFASDLLAETDLLVDGRYDATQHSTDRRWIGSKNQVLHFLTDRYSKDDPCFSEPNTLEIHIRDGLISLNGWPIFGPSTGSRILRKS